MDGEMKSKRFQMILYSFFVLMIFINVFRVIFRTLCLYSFGLDSFQILSP